MGKGSRVPVEQKLGFVMFLVVFGLIAASFAVKSCGGLNWEFSDGSRSGVLQKISKKGIFWKTWEGELNLGYTESTSDSEGRQTLRPAMFYFSVADESVAKRLKAAEIGGKRVTVDYKQYWLRGWDKGGTAYDVFDVVDNSVLTAESK